MDLNQLQSANVFVGCSNGPALKTPSALMMCVTQLEKAVSQPEAEKISSSDVCKNFIVTVKCDETNKVCNVKAIGPYGDMD